MKDRVRYSTNKGKPVLRVWWPDKLRSRIRFSTPEDGMRKKLTVELSLLDGTWEAVRVSLVEKDDQPKENHPHSFEGVADEYWNSWVVAHNKTTASKKSFLKRFKSRFRNTPPKMFTKIQADHYVAWRKGKVSDASINREMACLKHMFAWAQSRGIISKNILADYPKLEEQEWAGPKPTQDVINNTIEKLDPRFVAAHILMDETGARSGQIRILEHWMIDREKRIVTFAKRTKKGKTIIAPLTKEALEAIDSIPQMEGCPYVFYNPKTKQPWNARWFGEQWARATEAAGVPWLRARDLRAAFATKADELGAQTKAIASGLGHSSERVTEKFYIKTAQEHYAKHLLRVIEGGKSGTKTGTDDK